MELTEHEQHALLALLHSGVTCRSLDKLGLQGLLQRLSEGYDGPWEFNGRPKMPTLWQDYSLKIERSL